MKYNKYKKKYMFNQKKDGGFTFVEVIIAVCIFSIGLLAVATMQLSGTNSTASARRHTEAAVWASDRVEKIISLHYDHLDLADGVNGPVTEGLYTITWTVDENELIDNTKTISVTVSYDDRGVTKSIPFVYYKADI